MKKAMALVLAVLMIIGVAPFSAFAAEPVLGTTAAPVTAKADVPTKVSTPGKYEGYYAAEELYETYVEKNFYVEVPAQYDEVEFPSEPDLEQDPSYDPEKGTIKLAVTARIPSHDGKTYEGEFKKAVDVSANSINTVVLRKS